MTLLKPLFTLPDRFERTRARKLQAELSRQVLIEPLGGISTVAGLDAAYLNDLSWGAAVLTDPAGQIVESATSGPVKVDTPYQTGYLGFRETPAVTAALQKLTRIPDCIILDGHGIWHPRGCGLASLIGLMFDIPTIGCAKSPLNADWTEPGEERGAWTSIEMYGELVGATVRTRDGVKPVWVSPGHRCDVPAAVELVLQLSHSRLPEPLRLADQAASSAAVTLKPGLPESGPAGHHI